jgi:hypothetical protein
VIGWRVRPGHGNLPGDSGPACHDFAMRGWVF